MNSIRTAATLACAIFCATTVAQAFAQTAWKPDRGIEIISSSGPGGSNDKTARLLQKLMQDQRITSVPITVVNKPGGNQTLARIYLNQQAGDAHHVEIGNPTLIANQLMGLTTMHYRDFTPIALLFNEYTAFTVRAESPVKTLKELIEQLAKNPDGLTAGVSNRGGTNHVSLALVARAAGIDPRKLKVVVFKSNSESMTALLGGHIQIVSSSVPAALGHVANGKARMIALGSPQRMSGALAAVPTLKEQGIPVTNANWRAIIGPKGLPPAQVAWWEDTLSRVVTAEDWKKDLAANYWESRFLTGADLTRYLEADHADAKLVLTELGLAK